MPYIAFRSIKAYESQSFSILLCGYLGGFSDVGSGSQDGRLLTIEEVGKIMNSKEIGSPPRQEQKLT